MVGWVGLGWVGWLGWLAEFLPGWVGCARDADTADQTCDLGSHRRALQHSTFAVEAWPSVATLAHPMLTITAAADGKSRSKRHEAEAMTIKSRNTSCSEWVGLAWPGWALVELVELVALSWLG